MLGFMTSVDFADRATADDAIRRARLMVRLVSSLGGLRRQEFDLFAGIVVYGVLDYYARAFPFTMAQLEEVDLEWRKAYSRLGHRARRAGVVQMLLPEASGG